MRNTFAKTLYEIGRKNSKVTIVVADISPAGSMASFREEFPERFINVGVAEQNMIGLCAGMAQRGLKPFAYTIATFTIYRPFEMVRDDVCYQNLPVTLVGIGGGVTYSTLGGTHHAQEDIAVMSALPNMTIIAPCDPLEVESATWHCSESKHPVYLRLAKAGEPVLTDKAIDPWIFGKARYLRRGKDICVLSYGSIMKMAREVVDLLEKEGRSVSFVSVHTLKPLDQVGLSKILLEHKETVVIEEHSEMGGLAMQLKKLAWEIKASCLLKTFSLRDEFIHCYGSHDELLAAHGLHPDLIMNEILK
ncbi:MAG: transketolase [Bdellovibrionales bacterium]|nr:transketolase [Bdellovibrionales bacterium]